MATATPPPQIYRVVSRPLCSELRQHIKPAIGMMLENDVNIKKSPQFFKDYNIGALYGSDPSSATQGGQQQLPTETGSNAPQNMALLGLEGLIRPVANNIIAIQTMLDSPELRVGTGREDDDKRLQDIRQKLLQALATQNASLDIISGFVDTQQMADLQHAGQTYISSISQPDTKGAAATPAPDPLTSSPNYAGLPPNPYSIDLATIPGLTVGYNPVTRLIDALHWTIDQTSARENEAATAVMSGAALCSEVPLTSPPP